MSYHPRSMSLLRRSSSLETKDEGTSKTLPKEIKKGPPHARAKKDSQPPLQAGLLYLRVSSGFLNLLPAATAGQPDPQPLPPPPAWHNWPSVRNQSESSISAPIRRQHRRLAHSRGTARIRATRIELPIYIHGGYTRFVVG